ncbi:putative pyruvate kinase [Dioscorea sansibarensis]
MLPKIGVDDLSSVSSCFTLHQRLHPSHGFWNLNCQGLKLRGNLTFSTPKQYLTTSFYGDQLQCRKKERVNLRRCSVIFSKLQENDQPKENSWKAYGYYNHETEEDLSRQSSYSQSPDGPINLQDLLIEKLKAVHLHLLASERWNASQLKLCHRNYLVSAINLTHYLALQCLDVNFHLKEDLTSVGLLNLDHINSHILASITACVQLLDNLVSEDLRSNGNAGSMHNGVHIGSYDTGIMGELSINSIRKRVASHVGALFGPPQDKRDVHIMVTVGREAISNELMVTDILRAGANIVRINCAHDDSSVWSEIIRIVRNSSQLLEKPCRILMDLGGSKLRTGNLTLNPNVLRISPKKNAMGEFLPAQFWLCCEGSSPPAHLSPDAILYINHKFFNKLNVGTILHFVDVRGKKRSIKLVLKSSIFAFYGYMVESLRTVYVGLGTEFYIKDKNTRQSIGQVVKMPALEPFIRVNVGDLLTICKDSCLSVDNACAPTFFSTRITCSSDHLFDSVKPGEPIAFDDGKIWGEIRKTNSTEITVLITHADPRGSKLGPEKSINIPKSDLQFKGLTSKDLVDLEFIAANADMVGISFIRDVHDMVIVQYELRKRKLDKLGVVLKIETRDAFEKLPLILFQAMQSSNPLGVMIARGDLMVECGWDKMAHIQEHILSLCNAAHIPVVWATQVLESLVKFGLPTRAEITDAACATRANCIMLNKGEHIVKAVSALVSICSRNSAENTNTMFNAFFQSAHTSE